MAEPDLLDRVAAALAVQGIAAAFQKGPKPTGGVRPDAYLKLPEHKGVPRHVVEAKRHLTPATLGAALAQVRQTAAALNMPGMLVTDYVTPPMAELLKAQGQAFADAAGNCYLAEPRLMIYVTGRKPDMRPRPAAGGAFTPNGIKVLFALLCHPAGRLPTQRDIAAAAGVAVGAVPAILAGLGELGHMGQFNARDRRLMRTRRLLDAWATAYAQRLRDKTLMAVLQPKEIADWKNWDIAPYRAQWGGEPGGARLTQYLRPGIITLYVDARPARLLVDQRMREMKPPAKEGQVELRRRFWGDTLPAGPLADVTHPVLVYADLMATGDGRCFETAEMVYEQHIAQLFGDR